MTQTKPPRGQVRDPKMAVFLVAAAAVSVLLALSWHATSGRISALETRLQRLADTLDQRLPAGDWREELARATKRLESRVDDHIRSELSNLSAELDARVAELAATAALSMSDSGAAGSPDEAMAPAAGEMADSEWATEQATGSIEASGLEEEEVLEETSASLDGSGLQQEDHFGEMFESVRSSLKLEEERWAEVEVELEQILESLWPEYLELSNSRNPDTADLNRRYCVRVESVLSANEALRLGCGGSRTVSDLVEPQAGGPAP